MLARRSSFGDFTPGNGRVQCEALAKRTGLQCRKDSIGGQRRCKSHGGINGALATARAKGERLVLASERGLVEAMRFRARLDSPDGGLESDALALPSATIVEENDE